MRSEHANPRRPAARGAGDPPGPPGWAFDFARPEDAEDIARVRTLAADELTREYGHGPWSAPATARGVLGTMSNHSRILVARAPEGIVATLRLATRKPWAIDASLFTPVRRPIYLTDMAVAPAFQRRGVGRRLLDEAATVSRAWPGDAIRLDAFDAPAGAGGFYHKCGYRETGRGVYRGTPHIYFERLL